MLINRCVCFNVKFADVKKIMDENGFTKLEEVQSVIDVSKNCKLCRPYLEKMLETGETEFNYIIEKE
ncbi:MAG: (2Fe-2S)-binding protein [Ignavibacteria bacterium]|nr:(2Fe-2S)-binding protein [Ignavibacteria bacterium]